jgi:ribosomal protein S18 acetylase RimI-like enzyme
VLATIGVAAVVSAASPRPAGWSGYLVTLLSGCLYAPVAIWHFVEHANGADPELAHVLLAVAGIGMVAGAVLATAIVWIGHRRAAGTPGAATGLPGVPAETESRVTVRACRTNELTDVLALWRESRGRTGKTDDHTSLRALIERDRDALLIAQLDDRIVASLIAVWDGWRGNMYRLTVRPSLRRQGIARRLVAAGEERLRAMGARRISALVWREDGRAVRAWLSAGYQHDEGTGRFVKTLADQPLALPYPPRGT